MTAFGGGAQHSLLLLCLGVVPAAGAGHLVTCIQPALSVAPLVQASGLRLASSRAWLAQLLLHCPASFTDVALSEGTQCLSASVQGVGDRGQRRLAKSTQILRDSLQHCSATLTS